jgi:hypothetical protein
MAYNFHDVIINTVIMKTSALTFLAIFGTFTMMSQTVVPDGIAAPSSISNKFNTDYPDALPAWESDGTTYRAQYKDKITKRDRALVYDGNGNIIRTDNEMDRNAFPAGVSDYYKFNYPNEEPQVFVTEDNMGNRQYFIKRNSGMIWFDKNGKYISGDPAKTVAPEPVITERKPSIKKPATKKSKK